MRPVSSVDEALAKVRRVACERDQPEVVSVVGLGVDCPYESGPHGDVYSWFYDYSPDIDQSIESSLSRGYHPADYLQSGFIHLWTNDSGAGFEFVSSLYAGRNGGPYLIREWKDDESIARA